MMLLGGAMIQTGHFTQPDDGGLMPLGSAEENAAVAHGTGFQHVTTEAIDLPVRFPGFDGYWQMGMALAGPMAVLLRGLGDSDREAVRSVLQDYTAPFATDDGLTFPSRRLLTIAS